MHIAIIARGYPGGKAQGSGIFELDQAKALASIGHRVSLLAIDSRSIRHVRKPGFSRYSDCGVEVFEYSMYLGRVPFTINRFGVEKAALVLASRIEKELGPIDVVHGHFALQGIAALRVGAHTGTPVVYTEHCSGAMMGDERYLAIAREVYEKADRVISVSSALANLVTPWTNSEVMVVPNVVDVGVFSHCAKVPHESVNFVCTASLIPRKRQKLLLEAFSKLKLCYSDKPIKLVLVGDGPDKADLRHRISAHGLEDDVIFTGAISRQEMLKWYERSDCFVLPSARETFGVVYAEALCAGLPVIATKCGGPEDFVTPECGILIPVDDLSALIQAMDEVVTRKRQFDDSMVRNYAVSKFAPATIAHKLTGVYKSCL